MFTNLLFRRTPIRPIIRRPVYRRPVINQYGGAGNDIFYNNLGTGPQGPQGPTGPAGGLIVPVTLVTTTPFTPTQADYLLDVNVAGLASILLPFSPVGKVFIVKDISGAAATNPITVSAAGGVFLIDGSAGALINTNYGSITLIFNGSQWGII